MGIELYPQILSLNNARRCRHSKRQLVPHGASIFKAAARNRALPCRSESHAPHVRAAVDAAFSFCPGMWMATSARYFL